MGLKERTLIGSGLTPCSAPKAPCLVGTLKIGQKKDIRLDICRTYVGQDGAVDCVKLAAHFKVLAQVK